MRVLVRLDTGHVLLYDDSLPTNPSEMRELWRLTINHPTTQIAEAQLELSDRRFRISHPQAQSLNCELSHENVELARDALLYQLLSRRTTVSLVPGSDLHGLMGLFIAFDEKTVQPDQDPLSRPDVTMKIQEVLEPPPEPEPELEPVDLADIAPPPDLGAMDFGWTAADALPRHNGDEYLAELARSRDSRISFLNANAFGPIISLASRMRIHNGIPVVFDVDNRRVFFATYPLQRSGLRAVVDHHRWRVIAENHPDLKKRNLSRYYFLTIQRSSDGNKVVRLRYKTLANTVHQQPSEELAEEIEEVVEVLTSFLAGGSGRPYRVLDKNGESISFEQYTPWNQRWQERWEGSRLGQWFVRRGQDKS